MVDLEQLIKIGDVLARSIGHNPGCPKISPALPCICGASRQQAKALDDWKHAVADIKNSLDSKPDSQ